MYATHTFLYFALALCACSYALQCGNNNCPDTNSCCNDMKMGPTCYDNTTHACASSSTMNSDGSAASVLCGINEGACGTSCYQPAGYFCCNGTVSQIGQPCSTSASNSSNNSSTSGKLGTCATGCAAPTAVQQASVFSNSDFAKNLLDPTDWVKTPGGNVSYFNLTTNPALKGHGIAFSLAMLAPCGMILPHIHPRGSKGIYSITGNNLLVGFVWENAGNVVLNRLSIGGATVIPRGAIHFVQNLDCVASTQLDAYNFEDPGLNTVARNLFRFPDSAPATGLNATTNLIDSLRSTLSKFPLDVDQECLKRCGLAQ